MARPVGGTLRKLLLEIDPRKVAAIYESEGLMVCRTRWHWATVSIPALVEEGRRMRAAGETWKRGVGPVATPSARSAA